MKRFILPGLLLFLSTSADAMKIAVAQQVPSALSEVAIQSNPYASANLEKDILAAPAGPIDTLKAFKRFLEAVETGNTSLAQSLFQKMPGQTQLLADDPIIKGCRPLHIAAYHNNIPLMQYILGLPRAHVDAVDFDGKTALHLAVERGNLSAVKFLLERSAKSDIESKLEFFSPLHIAARKNLTDITRLLIGHNTDMNATDKNGRTPLHGASEACTKLLLDAGAEIKGDSTGITPLHLAAFSGAVRTVEMLSSAGAKVDARDFVVNDCFNSNQTALHYAAAQGHKDVVIALLERQATVDAETASKYTPLHYAVARGHAHIVKILIAAGANKNHKGPLGTMTPLMRASAKNNFEVVQTLLDEQVETNAPNCDTALHIACKNGHVDIAKLLLAHPADKNAGNQDTLTPLHCTFLPAPEHYSDRVELLRRQEIRPETPREVCRNNKLAIAGLLLAAGAQVDTRDKEGRTALHYAAKTGTPESIQLLLDHGASINTQDNAGMTPLHYAVMWNLPAISTLLKNNADRSVKTGSSSAAELTAADLAHEQKRVYNVQDQEILDELMKKKIKLSDS